MKNRTNETEAEFKKRYQTPTNFDDIYVALPCDCEDGGGPTHWAAIWKNEPLLIQHHLEFCAPHGTPWPEGINAE